MLRRTGDARPEGGSGADATALLLFLAALLSIISVVAGAQAAGAETVLEGSGIHYPGGFDPNTAGEVRGRASGFFIPEEGPVRFRLDTGKERYTVLASPPWYWNDLRVDIPDGSEVRVRGSITLGRDMNLYVIAQEIRLVSAARSWIFRDEDGFPQWRGRRGTGMGNGMGGASPMRRGGGGPGGPGGRRR